MAEMIKQVNGQLECVTQGHSTWCLHIKGFITRGDDASELQPGMEVIVPVIPAGNIWTTVTISEEVIVAGSALMQMEHTPDFGKKLIVPLGFWNPGEGRRSIRAVILDKLTSSIDPKEDLGNPRVITRCPAGSHTFAAQRKMDTNQKINWKWACLWNIVMEKACTPCVEESLLSESEKTGLGDLGGQQAPPWARNLVTNPSMRVNWWPGSQS